MKADTNPDKRLHEANKAAHDVARAAMKVTDTRGWEHVKAWRELADAVEEYRKAIGEER